MNYRNTDTKPYFSVTNTIIGGFRHTCTDCHALTYDWYIGYMVCVFNIFREATRQFTRSPTMTTEDTV